jgi:hypothetical protein
MVSKAYVISGAGVEKEQSRYHYEDQCERGEDPYVVTAQYACVLVDPSPSIYSHLRIVPSAQENEWIEGCRSLPRSKSCLACVVEIAVEAGFQLNWLGISEEEDALNPRSITPKSIVLWSFK